MTSGSIILRTTFFLLLQNIHETSSQRHWSDFIPNLSGIDDPKFPMEAEHDAMKITSQPSNTPSSQPSYSIQPSTFPSYNPTLLPSTNPSIEPTLRPSTYPSLAPTSSFAPSHERPSSSWNYNPLAERGPPNWKRVNIRDNEYQEFEDLDVNSNQCHHERQSPIDVFHNAKCVEHHQIRPRRGDYNFDTMDFQILPHTLRIEFPRELEYKVGNDTYFKLPPQADFPDGWPRVNAKHLDIKVPSEHKIYGRQYDGELQITHIINKRVIIIAAMLDSSQNEHNRKIQTFLDEWEEEFDEMNERCTPKRPRPRYLRDNVTQVIPKRAIPYMRTRPMKTKKELAEIFELELDDLEWKSNSTVYPLNHAQTTQPTQNASRHLQGTVYESSAHGSDYALYQILPTIWFFAYEGSFTTPPCSKIVNWRVLEAPIKISKEQLGRIQHILTHQLDRKCRRSTAAFQGRVNRPIQLHEGREIWHCTERDYGPDHHFKWPDLKPEYFSARDY